MNVAYNVHTQGSTLELWKVLHEISQTYILLRFSNRKCLNLILAVWKAGGLD